MIERSYLVQSGEPVVRSNVLLACRRTATEADDVAVGIFDIEVFRGPRGSRERLDDRRTVADALLVEGFDALDACRGIEMLVIAPVPALCLVLGCFLQVQFHSVQMTDSVETIPRLAELEADLLVVRDRALTAASLRS
jgi:hypothetical protein